MRRRPRLAPLDPDAFLAWGWANGDRVKGSTPVTVDDIWWELAPIVPGLSMEQVRRHYLGMAARVRRQQRLGLDPWAFTYGRSLG